MIVMFKIFCFLTFLVISEAHIDVDCDGNYEFDYLGEFSSFIINYNKTYNSNPYLLDRYLIFSDNMDYINHRNSLNLGYTLKMNKYGDYTFSEFSNLYKGYKGLTNSIENTSYSEHYLTLNSLNYTTIDWRAEGLVTDIKDQKQCGSCWAFSAVVTMEGAHAKETGNLTSLSEQDLVDCVPDCDGCDGGWPFLAVEYVINGSATDDKNVSGIDTEVSYSYQGFDQTCNFSNSSVGATFTNLTRLPQGSDVHLLDAVLTIGPISVAIDAEDDFQFYSSGIFNSRTCSNTELDHAVSIVGYGRTSNGTTYYIVKNSWGTDWGQDGYIYWNADIPNMCGISQDACYAF